jgi:hypothetical protein
MKIRSQYKRRISVTLIRQTKISTARLLSTSQPLYPFVSFGCGIPMMLRVISTSDLDPNIPLIDDTMFPSSPGYITPFTLGK